jgi:P27 family predicted phage terminase small subunit
MGARGPVGKSSAELKARGSRLTAKRRREEQRAAGPAVAPGCPAFLSREAKAEWRRVTKLLTQAGLIAELDRGALAIWCNGWGDFCEACAQIASRGDRGLVMTGSGGNLVVSPWVKIKAGAADRLLAVAPQLGLSPAARARLRGVETAGPTQDEFDSFLNRGRAAQASQRQDDLLEP